MFKRVKSRMKNEFKISILLASVLLFLTVSNSFSANFNPIKFVRDSLPNGLQIIYTVDKTAPVISTILHYRGGSRDEVKGKTGYAHFFEHLMFEATRDIPRATIDKMVQEAGGKLNAHTSWDETVFFFQLPANQLKLPLWIESQRMRMLKIDSVGVATQKGVVREELKMRTLNQPYGTLIQKISENMFPGSTYGWATVGFDEDLEKATIDDFKQFYDKYYQPNNACLVIAGDFNIDTAKKYVRQYFGAYQKAKESEHIGYQTNPLEKDYNETIKDTKAQVPAVFIGFRGPMLAEPDYYPVSLFMDIISSGESSRLNQRLVEKDRIAVNAAGIQLSLQYTGALILIGIGFPDKDIKDVEETLLDEVNEVISDGITDEELQKAKNIKESQFVGDKKNVLPKAESLAQYFSYYGNPSLINSQIDNYLSVTKEQVIKAAKKYFSSAKKVVLTYIPDNGTK
ncbi:MAG: insulinase family protein [Bacteroidetes bacterium]|nr:MAG: insulinase family protein [Bacteroidota bacterium]